MHFKVVTSDWQVVHELSLFNLSTVSHINDLQCILDSASSSFVSQCVSLFLGGDVI